jgi:hypothetical protein
LEAQLAEMKARLSTLQSELSLAQLRLSDSESEKNLYFTKLAQVDQYLSEALSQGGDTLPPEVSACLQQIQAIIV